MIHTLQMSSKVVINEDSTKLLNRIEEARKKLEFMGVQPKGLPRAKRRARRAKG